MSVQTPRCPRCLSANLGQLRVSFAAEPVPTHVASCLRCGWMDAPVFRPIPRELWDQLAERSAQRPEYRDEEHVPVDPDPPPAVCKLGLHPDAPGVWVTRRGRRHWRCASCHAASVARHNACRRERFARERLSPSPVEPETCAAGVHPKTESVLVSTRGKSPYLECRPCKREYLEATSEHRLERQRAYRAAQRERRPGMEHAADFARRERAAREERTG